MQQKWALILTRTQQRSNQFSQMTSLVRHKCALSICTKQSVSHPTLFLHFFRSSTRQHQTWVNKQHYVLLISPRKKWTRIWHSLIQMIYEVCYDSWIDLFFLLVCLCLTHLEEPLVQANYQCQGRRNPVTQTHVKNEGGRTQKNRQHLDLKKSKHAYNHS